MSISVYLVDDEPLALKRLSRLLAATGRVVIQGATTDPLTALAYLSQHNPELVFLDIHMPELSGFELLARLHAKGRQPWVIFTTAYDQYALRAFEVNSLDYLLKPIDAAQLERALTKFAGIRSVASAPDLREAIQLIAVNLQSLTPRYLDRLATRAGERVNILELNAISHFYAKDKLTYAATAGKDYVIEYTIAELAAKLDPQQFLRIHRATLVNIAFVAELHQWFGGQLLARLNDERHTELPVARDRVKALKERLSL